MNVRAGIARRSRRSHRWSLARKECFSYGALRDPIPLDWIAICLLFIDWLGWGDRDFESRDELVKVVVYGSYLFDCFSTTTIETVQCSFLHRQFRPRLVPKNFQDFPSHQIFRQMHGALNVDKKN
jgi:hypothetical protein